MPKLHGKKYIVQCRCLLSTWPEWRALASENTTTIGYWIFQDIICRWGSLYEIVTNNRGPFVKAMEYLSKQYQLNHIHISGYNSQANGIVEQAHFNVQQSLFKAAGGVEAKWLPVAYSVFWAEWVIVQKWLGCSLFYIMTGTEPLLPMDIVEALYLLLPPDSVLSTTALIAQRAIALQK